MNTIRFTIIGLCFVTVCESGCRKAEQKSSNGQLPGGKNAATTRDEPDVAQLLKMGGSHWSSLETFSSQADEFKAGESFWIWPAEDKVWNAKGEDLVIALRWKKRGDKVDNPVGAEIAGAGPGMAFRSYTPITGFEAGASQGAAEANFRFRYKGEGDVVVYLVGSGKKPASNLLRLKARSGP